MSAACSRFSSSSCLPPRLHLLRGDRPGPDSGWRRRRHTRRRQSFSSPFCCGSGSGGLPSGWSPSWYSGPRRRFLLSAWRPLFLPRGRLAHTRRVLENRQAYPDQLWSPKRRKTWPWQPCGAEPGAISTRSFALPGTPRLWQPVGLDSQSAYFVVRGILLALACALAYQFRRPWWEEPGAGRLAPEWAVVCLLSALLAPICWKQHLVLALPALFLVVRSSLVLDRPQHGGGAARGIGRPSI